MLSTTHPTSVPHVPLEQFQRVECRVLDTLLPGGDVQAVFVHWDLTAAKLKEQTGEFTVYDSWFEQGETDSEHTQKGRHFRLKGETLRITKQPGTARWVADDPWSGLERWAKVYGGDLAENSSQVVTVYHGDPSNYDLSDTSKLDGTAAQDANGSDVTVTAHYRRILPIASIDQNDWVRVRYEPDWYCWNVIDHECA
jgi:hypothetical protein